MLRKYSKNHLVKSDSSEAVPEDFPAASAIAPPLSKEDESANWNQLMDRVARLRDRCAFVALFDHFAPRVKGYLMRHGFAEDEAEEIAQDTMLQVWQKADYFDPERAAVSTWIYTIARNKKIDRLRKHRPMMLDLDDLIAQGFEPEEPHSGQQDILLDQAQLTRRLTDAIEELPKDQAELVQKAFFEDMSHADIAAATHIPLGTVKSRLRAGLARLRKTLFDQDVLGLELAVEIPDEASVKDKEVSY